MRVAVAQAESYQEEEVRRSFGELFDLLGYDADNPLGHLIKPGDRVFIKPNWVAHQYRKSCPRQDSVYSTITHPMVIRVLADYVAQALDARGQIIIGDNPSIDADFDRLMEMLDLADLRGRYAVPCDLVDLRPLRCADLKDYGKKHKMKLQPGDPRVRRPSISAGIRSSTASIHYCSEAFSIAVGRQSAVTGANDRNTRSPIPSPRRTSISLCPN